MLLNNSSFMIKKYNMECVKSQTQDKLQYLKGQIIEILSTPKTEEYHTVNAKKQILKETILEK